MHANTDPEALLCQECQLHETNLSCTQHQIMLCVSCALNSHTGC